MTQLERLKTEVAALPDDQLWRFRSWFDDFAAERWDREILYDSDSGKLDALAAEAVADYKSGKSKPL
jgi:hypothetical protein